MRQRDAGGSPPTMPSGRALETPHGALGAKSSTDAVRTRTDAYSASQSLIVIDLPLPPMQLHPNTPGGWRVKAGWTKATRAVAMGCAYNVRPVEPFASCMAVAAFRFTQRRHRDQDNLMAWLKATIDGLTDAAIWTDDSVVTWLPPVVVIEPGKPGGVTIRVWPVAPTGSQEEE